jgi:hypothetical protein
MKLEQCMESLHEDCFVTPLQALDQSSPSLPPPSSAPTPPPIEQESRQANKAEDFYSAIEFNESLTTSSSPRSFAPPVLVAPNQPEVIKPSSVIFDAVSDAISDIKSAGEKAGLTGKGLAFAIATGAAGLLGLPLYLSLAVGQVSHIY